MRLAVVKHPRAQTEFPLGLLGGQEDIHIRRAAGRLDAARQGLEVGDRNGLERGELVDRGFGGLNDGPAEAKQLAGLLRGRHAHVNLIPFNDVEGLPYRRPTAEAQQTFVETLRRTGVSVKVRKRKGADIDAACGQLRRKAEQVG